MSTVVRSGKRPRLGDYDITVPLNEETELAEGDSTGEAIPITAPGHDVELEYSATTEAEENTPEAYDLEPGITFDFDSGVRKSVRILGYIDVTTDEIGGPEEGAEDAVDVKIVDLEGNLVANSLEDAGADVAEGAAEFTFDTVLNVAEGDGIRFVVYNRPTGEETADGEIADYEVVASEVFITGT